MGGGHFLLWWRRRLAKGAKIVNAEMPVGNPLSNHTFCEERRRWGEGFYEVWAEIFGVSMLLREGGVGL